MSKQPIIPPPDWRLAVPTIIILAIWAGACSYIGFVAEHFIQKFW